MKKISFYFLFVFIFYTAHSQPTKKTMKKLPDTGQNSSYTNTFGEDNDYRINEPSFVKNSNGTTTDLITELMWQSTDGGEMTIENAIENCDTLTLGGFSDWRLPNCHELFSILNHDKTNPAIDTNYFTKTNADYWWSIQRQKTDSNKIWVTNVGGGVGNKPKSETLSAGGNKRYHVRAVRDIHTPNTLPLHFIDKHDGTIKDTITELMWTATLSADTITWEDALTLAENSNFAQHSDWRLPNIKELQSLNNESFISPSLDTNFFKITGNKQIWSSTTLPNKFNDAWYLDTRFGITTYAEKSTRRLYSLLVRTDTAVNTPSPFEPDFEININPNPANNQINVSLSNNANIANLIISIFDIDGKLTLTSNSTSIDVSSIPAGIYIVKINADNKIATKKILIHHP